MAKIEIDVLAKAKQAQAQIRGVTGDLGGMKKATTSAGAVFKGVLGSTVVTKGIEMAGAAIGKMTDVLADSVAEARESQKVNATTAQIIKATGGAAKITSDQVGDLATAISNKTGVDDEAIQSGANLLLTFKNVRNEAGKGSKIFDRATQAAADLSAAGFGSIEGSSKMLGKALNDPIKGISALGRAGVTFSEDQKKAIKKMTETGDVLGAQKIIMKEVESQVGGVAAANATAGEKAATTWANVKEEIGTALLPVLDQLANFFIGTVAPAITSTFQTVAPVLQQVGPIIDGFTKKLGAVFGGGAGGPINAQAFMAQVSPIVSGLQSVFSAVAPIVTGVVSTVGSAMQEVLPLLRAAAAEIGPIMKSIGSIITSVWKGIGPIILPTLKAVMVAVGGILKGAVQIISGVLKIVSSLLKGDWRGAWEGAKKVVAGVVQVVKSLVGGLVGVLKAQWGGLLSATLAKFGQIRSGISSAVSSAKATAAAGFASLVSTVTSKLAAAVSAVRALPGRVTAALGGLGSRLFGAGSSLIQGFIDGIRAAFGRVQSVLSSLTSMLPSWKGPPARDRTLLTGAGQMVIDGFTAGLRSRFGDVESSLSELTGRAVRTVQSELGIASPSRVFIELGKYVALGFAKGITGNQSSVTAALNTMATKAKANFKQIYDADKKGDLAAAREKLARAKKGWAEQQRAVQDYGKARAKIAQLERGGITKTERAQIKSLQKQAKAAKKILKQTDRRAAAVRKAEDRVKDIQARDTGAQALRATDKLMARYRKQIAAVQKNAKARDALAARITNEKKKLADLIKVRNDYAASVRDNARAFADSTKVELGENENLSAAKIAQSLRDRLNAIQNFNLKLARLKKLGIDTVTYDQIVQAGVEGGMATADALLAGGKSAINEVKSIQVGIKNATSTLGNATADTMYKAGIQAQQGLVNGLTADLAKLDKAAKKMADQLTKAFKKALGIKSPSRVFQGLGKFVTDGLEIGLDDRKIAMAGKILAGDLVDGFAKPVLRADAVVPAGMGAGAAGSRTYEINVHVPVSADKVAIGREIVGAVKAFERAGGKL